YQANASEANELILESSPLVPGLRQLAEGEGWQGTASDLLQRLTTLASEDVARSKDWPKKPHTLSGRLRRLAPNLRRVGIDVGFHRASGGQSEGKRTRTISLQKRDARERPPASPASPVGEKGDAPGPEGDTPGPQGDASGQRKTLEGTLGTQGDAQSAD